MNDVEELLKKIGVGPRSLDDPFFNESYKVCNIFRRQGVTVDDEEELCHKMMEEFPCNVPGCKDKFQNLLDFEIHYNGSHRFICEQCKKSLPTPRILDIHIQETHDTFFQVLAERQSVYQCFVSECDVQFSDPDERRKHCISVHKFAKHFRFDTSNKHRKGKHKETKGEEMEIDQSERASQQKKTNVLLNKNQKFKSFRKVSNAELQKIENDIKSMQIETKNAQPSCTVSVKPNSALMFLPRQVLQKSHSKTPAKVDNSKSNVCKKGTSMDLEESLPID